MASKEKTLLLKLIDDVPNISASHTHSYNCSLYIYIYRKLRAKVHVKLFLNSSAAFILLYIIYIGAMFSQDDTSSCIVFSALLHYAFLVVLTAMLLESSLQFFKQVWKSPDYYPIIAVFITWSKFLVCKPLILLHWLYYYFPLATPILVVLFCVAPAHYLYATER